MRVSYTARWATGTGTEPRGVRIRHGDGTISECVLVREPGRRRIARWMAVPPDGTVFDPAADSLQVDLLPARTSVMVPLAVYRRY